MELYRVYCMLKLQLSLGCYYNFLEDSLIKLLVNHFPIPFSLGMEFVPCIGAVLVKVCTYLTP